MPEPLSNLIDSAPFQELLEAISLVLGVSLTLLDVDGQEIGQVGTCHSCRTMHPKMAKDCQRCQMAAAEQAAAGQVAVHFECPLGYAGCAVPVQTDGRTAAVVMMNQFFSAAPDEQKLLAAARAAHLDVAAVRDVFGHSPVILPQQAEHILSVIRQTVEHVLQNEEQHSRVLQESENRYRLLLEAIPDAVLVIQGERYIYMNAAALQLFAVAVPNEWKKVFFSQLHPDDRAWAVQSLERAQNGEVTRMKSVRVIHLQRGRMQFDATLVPIHMDGRASVAIIGRDVTEERRKERLQQATYQISELIHTAAEMEDVFDQVYAILRDLMPMHSLQFTLLPEGDDEPRSFVRPAGDLPPSIQRCSQALTDYVLRTGHEQTISPRQLRDVFAANVAPAFPLDPDACRSCEHPPAHFSGGPSSFEGSEPACWLAAPLLQSGRVMGVLSAQSAWDGISFSPEDLRTLQFIASQLAVAVERKQSSQRLYQSEEKFRNLVEHTSDWIWEVNTRGVFTFVSPRIQETLGYSPQDLLGKRFDALLTPEQSNALHQAIRACFQPGTPMFEFEGQFQHQRGTPVIFQISGAPYYDQRHQLLGYIGVCRDITQRRQAEDALRESEERYMLAVRGANDGLWDWNLKTDHVYYSARWKEMLGFTEEEIGSAPSEWMDRIHPEDAAQVREALQTHLRGESPLFMSAHRLRCKGETDLWVMVRGVASRSAEGAYRIAGSLTDIHAQKMVEQRLQHDAMHDLLTGLQNRTYFVDQLRYSMDRHRRRPETQLAVLFLDLDRFKMVNDSLGHAVGDLLLAAFARRLEPLLRPGDILARFSGDEFAILMEDIKGVQDAAHLADLVQQALTYPFYLQTQQIFSTVSIGIVLFDEHHTSPDDVLRDADTALYRAKTDGRAGYAIFNADMHLRSMERFQLEADMRRAVAREEFRLVYQPIVTSRTGKVAAVEALLRWQHPERGLLLPAAFIAAAEETGLIVSIGEWVLRRACWQLRQWRQMGSTDLRVAVNVSARQFRDPFLPDRIRRVLNEAGLPGSALELEITESEAMHNMDLTLLILKQLRDMGVHISIDDFGTSYSSLGYLKRLSVSRIKIDYSFVRGLPDDEEAASIVQAIIALAHALKLDVVAEGVETSAQRALLTQWTCDYIQGYLICRPVRPADLDLLLRSLPQQ